MKKVARYATIIVLILFGLLTLFLSSSIIFDLFGIREKEGNFLLFIVWANFVSSILYLIAAYGLLNLKKWSPAPLLISAVILILAFFGLLWHIDKGGIYETKTVGAMIFRTTLTLIFTISSYYILKNKLDRRK